MAPEPNLDSLNHMSGHTLVIENDPTDDARRLGDWLSAAGLTLTVVRPHAGDPLPADLDGVAGLVVLGGEQSAYDDPAAEPAAAWFPALESLLRKAVRHGVPTLAICLGAQLLAQAHGGIVEPAVAGPEIGPRLAAKRDKADDDPLFADAPILMDVLQWHSDEIVALPVGATLLAASTNYPNQAFRLGEKAWGVQFHIECDTQMVASWALDSIGLLRECRIDPEGLLDRTDAAMVDLEEAWRPFAERFAKVVRGELAGASVTGRPLPLLGH
jgi:GMP synthase-like glutamine amidotransferase